MPGFSRWEEEIGCKGVVRTCWDEGDTLYHDYRSHTIAIHLTKCIKSDTLKGQILHIKKSIETVCLHTQNLSSVGSLIFSLVLILMKQVRS